MSEESSDGARYLDALAELLVRFGANVQPDQVVGVSTEPGKEPLARAIAEHAYRAGARFVDVVSFDPHVKRARIRHADPNSLGWVPPWYGERVLELGALRGAVISTTGPVEPHLMDDLDPALLGRDMLPRVKESNVLINERTVNWTIGPGPTRGWAELVYPDVDGGAALDRLWDDIAHVCRLKEPDPIRAWQTRIRRLLDVTEALTSLRLDTLRYEGPGTDLTVGLLPSTRWICAKFETADGIVHVPNLPSEEVFTTPDPARVDGVVTATKPLFTSGRLITGLRVRFESGSAIEIDADEGAATLRALTERDSGGARLGEVALVDRESRIGQLGTVFYDTLLDENAASHLALGQGFPFALAYEADQQRVNTSEIHVDFMIGSSELAVTGITRDGTEVPLLRDGAWQML